MSEANQTANLTVQPKSPVGKPKPKSKTRFNGKKAAKEVTDKASAGSPQSGISMVDVAIARSDAETTAAANAYVQRKTENIQALLGFMTDFDAAIAQTMMGQYAGFIEDLEANNLLDGSVIELEAE